MSCCGGNCGCGTNCTCGSGCGGCKMYPDMSCSEVTAPTVAAAAIGVAPKITYGEGKSESVECGAAENGCKCGDNCTCSPCNCK